jgi:hypothetical protein
MTEKDFSSGDRVVYKGTRGTIKARLRANLCMIALDTGHLIAAPTTELQLIEKHQDCKEK